MGNLPSSLSCSIWSRGKIASLAEQWHPANVVLVAQLPARQWHLKFWNYGSAGEELIDERRRDIRRTPYCDEQGVPTIRVVRNYLVMKEMPVLVVPLMALGEIEGYVFLCGDRAETAHRSDPSIAARLSTELGLIMRRRRLGRASLTELSVDGPRAKGTGDLVAADAILRVGDEPHARQPLIQTKGRVLKDRPRLQRELPLRMAGLAFPAVPRGVEVDRLRPALRARDPIRPTAGNHEFPAVFGAFEVTNRFQKG